jgi:hypothetical protein
VNAADVAAYIAIAASFGGAFGGAVSLPIRASVSAVKALAEQLAGLREDVAELRGYLKGRTGLSSGDGASTPPPSVPGPGQRPGGLASLQSVPKRQP